MNTCANGCTLRVVQENTARPSAHVQRSRALGKTPLIGRRITIGHMPGILRLPAVQCLWESFYTYQASFTGNTMTINNRDKYKV